MAKCNQREKIILVFIQQMWWEKYLRRATDCVIKVLKRQFSILTILIFMAFSFYLTLPNFYIFSLLNPFCKNNNQWSFHGFLIWLNIFSWLSYFTLRCNGKNSKSNRLFNQNTQKGKPQINDFHGMSNENQEKKSALMICQHTKKMRQNS